MDALLAQKPLRIGIAIRAYGGNPRSKYPVQARFAQELAELGDMRLGIVHHVCRHVTGRIAPHRTKLVDVKLLLAPAHAALFEDRRPLGINLDQFSNK